MTSRGLKVNYLMLSMYGTMAFIVINVLIAYMYLDNYRSYVQHEVAINIEEYEEVDLSHICQMFECSHIDNGTPYININDGIPDKNVFLVAETYKKSKSNLVVMKDLYISSDNSIIVEVHTPKLLITTRLANIMHSIGNWYYVVLVGFILSNIIFLIYSYIVHKSYQFRTNVMLHHDGYNKSMMMLTENIHHELNTPLSVINNKVMALQDKINRVISGDITKEQCDVGTSARDFEIIIASLHQIADLLNRMRPFKDVKRQNERDIKTVISTACDMLLVSQHEMFDYDVVSELSDYKLDGSYMNNGELTAILLNFVKNSIDANACNIKFLVNSTKNTTISIYIVDDGNGIPQNIQPDIFKENRSSKSASRGSGLYVNKFLVDAAGGGVALVHSGPEGTIFELKLKIKEYQ